MIISVCKDSEGDGYGRPQDSTYVLWAESGYVRPELLLVFLPISGKTACGCQCCGSQTVNRQAGRCSQLMATNNYSTSELPVLSAAITYTKPFLKQSGQAPAFDR